VSEGQATQTGSAVRCQQFESGSQPVVLVKNMASP
jgi:hypothetical protein